MGKGAIRPGLIGLHSLQRNFSGVEVGLLQADETNLPSTHFKPLDQQQVHHKVRQNREVLRKTVGDVCLDLQEPVCTYSCPSWKFGPSIQFSRRNRLIRIDTRFMGLEGDARWNSWGFLSPLSPGPGDSSTPAFSRQTGKRCPLKNIPAAKVRSFSSASGNKTYGSGGRKTDHPCALARRILPILRARSQGLRLGFGGTGSTPAMNVVRQRHMREAKLPEFPLAARIFDGFSH